MASSVEESEEAWCAGERTRVIEYLKQAQLSHGEVGDWPAWHVWPQVALWAVESISRPGWVGWWVISGDVPTDYVTCGPERHPREGVRAIAERWQSAASEWKQGDHSQGWHIGAGDDEAALAPLLASRASLLLSWLADDSFWPE